MPSIALRSLLLATVLGSVACGEVADDTDEPSTLIQVGGTVSNPRGLAVGTGKLRVAVLWHLSSRSLGDGNYSPQRRSSQEVSVETEFPVRYSVDIDHLPPVTESLDGLVDDKRPTGLRTSAGLIVAYEDVNGNGQLDLVTADAPGYVDRLVGRSSRALMYIEGSMPADTSVLDSVRDASGRLPPLGFSSFLLDCDVNAEPGNVFCPSGFQWLPSDGAIDIELDEKPEFSTLMCSEFEGGIRDGSWHLPDDPPMPPIAHDDPRLRCAAGGRRFSVITSWQDPGLCQPVNTFEDTYSLSEGDPAPSDWPCPLN